MRTITEEGWSGQSVPFPCDSSWSLIATNETTYDVFQFARWQHVSAAAAVLLTYRPTTCLFVNCQAKIVRSSVNVSNGVVCQSLVDR